MSIFKLNNTKIFVGLFFFFLTSCKSGKINVVYIDMDFQSDKINCPKTDVNLIKNFSYKELDINPFDLKNGYILVDANEINREIIEKSKVIILLKKSNDTYKYIQGMSVSANIYISLIADDKSKFKLFSYVNEDNLKPIIEVNSEGNILSKLSDDGSIVIEEESSCGMTSTKLKITTYRNMNIKWYNRTN